MNAVVAFPSFDLPIATETVSLGDLYLSPMNPRQDHDQEGIALLAESLVSCGLMQNLGGIRDADGKVAVVFGGRRLAALQIAVQSRADLAQVPVAIAPDEATALKWGIAENVVREDMNPHQEITAYGRMRQAGSSVTEIASAFAVTEAQVYRRLKLAGLHSAVLEALRDNNINLTQAEVFTISDDPAQIEATLEYAVSNRASADTIRRMLARSAVEHTNRKAVYVGIEAYQAAGGTLTKDLFGDTIYLNDAALLDSLFDAKLEDDAKTIQAEWAWVETCETTNFPSWESAYTSIMGQQVELSDEQSDLLETLRSIHTDERTENDEKTLNYLVDLSRKRVFTPEQKAVAGMVALVNWNGKLTFDGPYVRPEDGQKAKEAGVISGLSAAGEKKIKPKSAFSQAVKDDLKAIRLHSVQSALRKNQKLALSLIAFSMSGEAGTSGLLGLRIDAPKIEPSDTDSFEADAALVAEKEAYKEVPPLEEAFSDFCQKPDSEIMDLLIAGLVRTMHTNFGIVDRGNASGFFDTIVKAVDADTRATWTPTKASFWGRMPSAYIDEQFAILTGYDEDSKEYQAFAAQKKGSKAEEMDRLFTDPEYQAALGLSEDRIEAIAAWMPEADA